MATQWTAGTTSGQVLTAATLDTIGAAWVDYTPTLTQGVAVTKTVSYARYCQVQKLIMVEMFLICTSAGTPATGVRVGLPITAKNTGQLLGSGLIYDASTNTMYNTLPYGFDQNTAAFYYQTGSEFGVSPAVTLANTDQIRLKFTYEAN
jgi:hypothetical protein